VDEQEGFLSAPPLQQNIFSILQSGRQAFEKVGTVFLLVFYQLQCLFSSEFFPYIIPLLELD
jgi:hypothetical protein